MLIAIVVFNAVHPGRVMRGEEADMPKFWQKAPQRNKVSPSGISLLSVPA